MWIFIIGCVNASLIMWAFYEVKKSRREVTKTRIEIYEEIIGMLYDLEHLQDMHLPERTEKTRTYIKTQMHYYTNKARESELLTLKK